MFSIKIGTSGTKGAKRSVRVHERCMLVFILEISGVPMSNL